jgi:2-polyprenyl-3-methyl-5-hydroxy-6-metoxy-1,4-benzoquinol methylase
VFINKKNIEGKKIMKKIISYINAILNRLTKLFLKLRYFLQRKLNLTKMYQPNPFIVDDGTNIRDCLERFSSIDEFLPREPLSCLDIGCNEGFFVFKLADRGGFCVGVDSGRNEIMAANSIKSIYQINNVIFSNMHVEPKDFKGFPIFNVVIFLSVFHHLVKNNGVDFAKNFVREIASINSKYLVFETGQPNEKGVTWAENMNFMLPDVDLWVKKMLLECGYKKVTIIGKNKSIRSDVQRFLFLAEK